MTDESPKKRLETSLMELFDEAEQLSKKQKAQKGESNVVGLTERLQVKAVQESVNSAQKEATRERFQAYACALETGDERAMTASLLDILHSRDLPFTKKGYRHLGSSLKGLGQIQEALSVLQEGIKTHGEDHIMYALLGQIYSASDTVKSFDNCLYCFQKSSILALREGDIVTVTANTLLQAMRMQSALRVKEITHNLDGPEEEDILLTFYMKQGSEEALASFKGPILGVPDRKPRYKYRQETLRGLVTVYRKTISDRSFTPVYIEPQVLEGLGLTEEDVSWREFEYQQRLSDMV